MPAPRDLDWDEFVTLWKDIAEKVEDESGDRLSVTMNGHREVFRRPHDGRVSIEDVERARHLLKDHPIHQGAGHVLAVVIDERSARILDFDLNAVAVQAQEKKIHDPDGRSRHLRTVERHTGNDDQQDLKRFFDEVATEVRPHVADRLLVVLGHGSGKSDAAAEFVERLRHSHSEVAQKLAGVATVDLSAANDADLEKAAADALTQGV